MRRFLLPVGLLALAMTGNAAADSKQGKSEPSVLMQKGKIMVTEQDLEAVLHSAPEEIRLGLRASTERINKLLKAVYLKKLLAEEARANGLDQNPTARNRIEQAEDKVLADLRLEQVVKQASKPDLAALAKEEYLANPHKYETQEEVQVSHILISVAKRSEDEARDLAEKVRVEATQGKISFAELVEKYSEDPTAQTNHGDLGFFTRGKMVKPFEEVAFAMQKQGDISPVVKTQFGFHVIRFEGRNQAVKQPFEEVKSRLIHEAEQRYFAQVRDGYLNKVGSAEGVYINFEAIKKLRKPLPDEKSQGNKPEAASK